MKRFITNILIFGGFSLAAYLVLLIVVGTLAPSFLKQNLNYRKGSKGYMYSRLQDVANTRDVDVLVLGSSHAYHGYDPRNFAKKNLKTFNLGSSAQTPLQTEILVDKYLDQLNPKMVIIDIYPITFASDGVESSIDLISNASLDPPLVKMALQTSNIKVVNTMIYGFIKESLQNGNKFKEPIVKGPTTYIPGGFVQTFQEYKPVKPIKSRNINIADSQMEAFNRIIEKLKSKNIKYILVQTPITRQSYQSFENNEEVDSVFRTKGTYYNFNKILPLPDSLFSDDSHLNQNGVNAFNNKLMEILEKKS